MGEAALQAAHQRISYLERELSLQRRNQQVNILNVHEDKALVCDRALVVQL